MSQRQASPSATRRSLTGAAALFAAVLVSVAWAQQEGAVGLQGIFGGEVPAYFSDTLSGFPENWQAWGESVTAELEKLYNPMGIDVPAQRQVLDTLKRKLNTIDKALANPQYRALETQLLGLRGALSRRVLLAEAFLDTLEIDAASSKPARLAATRQRVEETASALEADLEKIPGGSAWIGYVNIGGIRAAVAEGADRAASIPVLEAAHARLSRKLDDKTSENFLSRKYFHSLKNALQFYLDVAKGYDEPVNVETLRQQMQALAKALDEYEATDSNASSTAARTAYAELRKVAGDGGARVIGVLQTNYFNYNVRVTASEDFLKKYVQEVRNEQGGVRDWFMCADIYGCQVTSTNVSLDLLPNGQGASFAITLDGTVNSNTQGYTSQATIYTQGNHQFFARKEIDYNDGLFTTQPGTIAVHAQNTTTGATTKFSGIPIIGGIANRTAMDRARANTQAGEAHAAGRIQERMMPKLNEETDKKFNDLNGDLTRGEDRMRNLGVYPDASAVTSSDTEVKVFTRLMSADELGGSDLPVIPAPPGGVLLQLHESLINNVIDKLELGGKTMTGEELRHLIEEKLSTLLDREVNLKKGEEEPAAEGAETPAPAEGNEAEDKASEPKALVFSETDPLRIRFVNGQVLLVIRAGFTREGKDNIPTQIVTVPLTFTPEGDKLLITRGSISIEPAEAPANAAEQVATAGVVRRKLETTLPDKRVDRKVKIKKSIGEFDAWVGKVQAYDGWVTITLN